MNVIHTEFLISNTCHAIAYLYRNEGLVLRKVVDTLCHRINVSGLALNFIIT